MKAKEKSPILCLTFFCFFFPLPRHLCPNEAQHSRQSINPSNRCGATTTTTTRKKKKVAKKSSSINQQK